jgi:mannosyltransferase
MKVFLANKNWLAPATLLIILIAATLIRLYGLSDRSFWFDEAFAWRLIDYPWLEMVERVTRDNSPPFYYLVLKAWSQLFGTSPVALRSLSLLFGLVTVAGAYLFCVEAFGRHSSSSDDSKEKPECLLVRARSIGLLAAALVAFSALQIRYSWETRAYALATALTISSSWALLRALRGRARWGCWLLYAFLAILLAYTHYFGLYALAGQAVFALYFLLVKVKWDLRAFVRLPEVWRALSAAAIVSAAWLPWLPVFLHQHAQVRASFWTGAVTPWRLAAISYRMFSIPDYVPEPSHQSALLAADGCLLGLWFLRRQARAGEWLVISLAVAPFLLSILAACTVGAAVVTVRYFIMGHLFLLIGLAVLVFRIPFLVERTAAVVVLLGAFALIALDSYAAIDLPNHPGARAAAEFIDSERAPGEAVIVSSPLYYTPLLYHTKKAPDVFLYSDGSPIPHYYGTAVLSADELISQNQLESLRSRRVWVVNMSSPNWGKKNVLPPAKWVQKRTRAFPDLAGIGDFNVIEYDTGGALAPLRR